MKKVTFFLERKSFYIFLVRLPAWFMDKGGYNLGEFLYDQTH
jgi:hypothetical protein